MLVIIQFILFKQIFEEKLYKLQLKYFEHFY